MISDEKFFAWLDGELPASEAAEMQALVASDPELARRADEHRAMQSRLRRAFDGVTQMPVPKRLAAAARPQLRNVIDIAGSRDKRSSRFFRPLPQWAAIAAVLVLGLVTGTFIGRDLVSSPVEVRGSGLYAAGPVEQALDTRLASAPASGAVRIGLTFRNRSGSICRSFDSPQASGLACRDGGRWRLRGLFAPPEGQSSQYRMAAGIDPDLAALIDSAIAGEPLDAAQEQAAKQDGWR